MIKHFKNAARFYLETKLFPIYESAKSGVMDLSKKRRTIVINWKSILNRLHPRPT